MSVEPAKAAELLSSLYVEREKGQWTTVANCLDDLMKEGVVSYNGLASVALDLAEQDSPFYDEIIIRARKINNRIGIPGHLEAQRLAVAAIELAVSNNKYDKLAAHISRIGFNRNHGQKLTTLVEIASKKTRTAINKHSRDIQKFGDLSEPLLAAQLLSALKKRDEFIHNELWRRDNVHAVTLACMAGQLGTWEAVDLLLGPHSSPYPFEYELIASQACFSVIADEGQANLTKVPAPPDGLQVRDTVNFPILSFITFSQNAGAVPKHAARTKIPLADFAQQLLLEMIYLRLGAK